MSDAGQAGAGNAPAGSNWFETFDPDLQSHVKAKGWDKLSLDEAAKQAVFSHASAEKMIGVPVDQLFRFPKDASDKAAYDKLYSKLGVPAKPEEYDFKELKFTDGTAPEPEFVESVRGLAAKYHMTKDDARGLASDLMKSIETEDGTEKAEYEAGLNSARETLKSNWGANYAANMATAQNAFNKILESIPAEKRQAAMSALEKSIGYDAVMEMFRNVGSRIGEDRFVANGQKAGGVMSKEQAIAELKTLQNDDGWRKKYLAGDTSAKLQFDNLTQLIAA